VVISSPLVRCTQTAQAICDRVAGPTAILVDERFIEMDYGEFEGTAVADVPAEVWQRWRADPSWRPIGGESLVDVSARVDEALRDLVSSTFPTGSEMGDDVVIVTHVSPIKAALGWVLGIGPDISWRCHVAQASVHRIDPGGPVPRLVSFNETHHLVS